MKRIVVSGPSCAGKSTYLVSLAREGKLLPPVAFAFEQRDLSIPHLALHYNILRPFLPAGPPAELWGVGGASPDGSLGPFARDDRWREFVAGGRPEAAVVLVAGRRTLLERA